MGATMSDQFAASAPSQRDQCAIVGVGTTDYSFNSGRSTLTLAAQAGSAAIADAGLEPADIDGIVRCEMDEVLHADLAATLGLPNVAFWAAGSWAGAAPCGMVGLAVSAICAGQANNVLVFRSLNGRSGRRFGREWASGDAVGGGGSYLEFLAPYGLQSPGMAYALFARKHMLDFGTTSEHLGHIAVTCHRRANENPAAQRYGRPLSMATYLQSRMIADPLRRFDFCLETDGAAAVVVSAAERARDLAKPTVLIRAVAQGDESTPRQGGLWGNLLTGPLTNASSTLAKRLYRLAGLGPNDIDVAQFYDCFTITVLMQLEDYGFCKRGEGGPFAASGALDIDGTLPINTSGGNLADGYIHGLSHIVEGVRQLRGESTAPVAGAETCLVTSGMPGPGSSALILRRGQ
ncbi:lipid-transfer protein [Mycolicibacterium elephantis]|uniref:Lipid-transfer protein n=2 Tax=Mycolicibacterium elephantis TaxID=81858 RepID=A0A439DTC1_9MYCO|nr:lipid-transfer protein [Mycolicibacterium elephantis]RWA19657.1 lipid-transfer protein [Mycolicibacterium elephantis DSM 44368]